MEPLYVIIRFVNGPGFVSWGIDHDTDSLWDHVEVADSDGSLDPAKISAWIGAHAGTGVQARPVNYCVPTRERRYAVPVTPVQFKKIMDAAHSAIGTKYDYMDILGLLLKNRRFHDPHRLICSAFSIKILQFVGGVILLNVIEEDCYLVTPETLHLSPTLVTGGARCVYVFPPANGGISAKGELQN